MLRVTACGCCGWRQGFTKPRRWACTSGWASARSRRSGRTPMPRSAAVTRCASPDTPPLILRHVKFGAPAGPFPTPEKRFVAVVGASAFLPAEATKTHTGPPKGAIMTSGIRHDQLRLAQRSLARSIKANRRHRETSLFESLESRQMLSSAVSTAPSHALHDTGRTAPPPAGTWTTLNNNDPSGQAALMMLSSDGSVLVHNAGPSKEWYKLAPDSNGSYVNGNWTLLTPMNVGRQYFGSNVLPSGKVFVVGGEYGNNGAMDLNTAEIYDPVANTWTNVPSFPRAAFGDDPTQLLGNGTVLAGYISGPETYVFNPIANTWTQTGTKRNNDRSDEETWLQLPDGSVLSYDIFSSWSDTNANHAQRYNWASGQWTDAGNPPILLSAPDVGYELGPALLLPDGRAMFVGALNATEIYNPNTNVWTTAPPMPNGYVAADAPGAMLPNGDVLLAGSPQGTLDSLGHYTFPGPQKIFEFNPTAGTYLDVTPSPSILSTGSNAFIDNMLVLPTGQ